MTETEREAVAIRLARQDGASHQDASNRLTFYRVRYGMLERGVYSSSGAITWRYAFLQSTPPEGSIPL